MFFHAKNDKLIGVEHTLDIYEQYPGVKCVYHLEKGRPNSKRLDTKYLNEEYANNIIHEK